jgi:hypothetical protein
MLILAGIARSPTGYGLDGQGSIPGRGKIFFSIAKNNPRRRELRYKFS